MRNSIIASAAGIAALAAQLQAQDLPIGSHYPIGAEGLKGADLPPPGLYVRDYNYFYTADTVDGLPVDLNLNVYVNAVKVVYLTDCKILGANWGVDTIVPFMYKNITGALGSAGQFNLGDIYACPMLLSWHLQQFDFCAALGVWAPSGKFDASTPLRMLDSPGDGFWTPMATLGVVWYPDEKKTWALSLLNRYEISTEQDQTDITPGNMYSLEWGLSKTVHQGVDVGLAGYWQQQTTQDSGTGAATALSHVVGIGPEVSVFWEKLGLISSLRYEYEVNSKDRPQGQAVVLTLTKRF
ncbi:MAG TPA: transporter [Candidatus Acidoferrales bacterium]|nr:transporter [Candidatus Acidoferrales bacterium]